MARVTSSSPRVGTHRRVLLLAALAILLLTLLLFSATPTASALTLADVPAEEGRKRFIMAPHDMGARREWLQERRRRMMMGEMREKKEDNNNNGEVEVAERTVGTDRAIFMEDPMKHHHNENDIKEREEHKGSRFHEWLNRARKHSEEEGNNDLLVRMEEQKEMEEPPHREECDEGMMRFDNNNDDLEKNEENVQDKFEEFVNAEPAVLKVPFHEEKVGQRRRFHA